MKLVPCLLLKEREGRYEVAEMEFLRLGTGCTLT